jgi:hypothetical protein
MKTLLTPFLALGFALSVASLSAAEYKTLISTGSGSATITLLEGDIADILYLQPSFDAKAGSNAPPTTTSGLAITIGGSTLNIPQDFDAYDSLTAWGSSWGFSVKTAPSGWIRHGPYPVIVGPATITCSGNGNCLASLKITTAAELAGASQTTAKYATVIPENAQTNVDVVLEQSTDLVNWTAVTPGQFAPSAQKRFFRLRSANVPVAVTGATNASPIVVTSTGHSLNTGDAVSISGVAGNTAANGVFTVTKIDANTFSLNGSTGNAAYVSGGTWLPSP